MNIVEANNLTKIYGGAVIIDDVSLKISGGEVYGFLGLNGAGKTTTIRMLLGMIKPTHGAIRLFGQELKKFNWQGVGYMVESTRAYPNLTVLENLMVFQRYYGLTGMKAISSILSLLNLGQYKDTKAEHLSLGNLQRLGLAKALLPEPGLLILDEPVNGLDPAGIVEVRKLLKELSGKGVTILISSHLLGEISKIAHKIGIIHKGQLVREIKSQELNEEMERKLVVNTNKNDAAIDVLQDSGIKAVLNAAGEIEIADANARQEPERVTRLLTDKHLPPKKIFLYEEDLESYFLRIISQKQS